MGAAGKSRTWIFYPISECVRDCFFFHEAEEITQKVAILDLTQILLEEMVENLKVEVNSSERDHKNDKSSTLPLNCK